MSYRVQEICIFMTTASRASKLARCSEIACRYIGIVKFTWQRVTLWLKNDQLGFLVGYKKGFFVPETDVLLLVIWCRSIVIQTADPSAKWKWSPQPIHHGYVISIAMQFVSIKLLLLFCTSFWRNKYFIFMYCTPTFFHSLCGQIATPRFAKSILSRAWISLSISIYTLFRPLYSVWYCIMVLGNIHSLPHNNLHYPQHISPLQTLLQISTRV
jgi:hypothetical protein